VRSARLACFRMSQLARVMLRPALPNLTVDTEV
jgi:hypothetical protein